MSEEPSVTIDLPAMLERRSPALTRLARVPTPDEQLSVVLNTPNISPAQVDFARKWAAAENERRANFGRGWVKDATARNAQRARGLADAIHVDTQLANDLYDRARRGDFAAVDELFAEGARIRQRLRRYEQATVAIETTEETIGLVAADPVSHFYDFYGRYSALAEGLPTLAQALHERDQN
jgi:hypothetical protein